MSAVTPTEIHAMAKTQTALVELRSELLAIKTTAPTPAVAEALRLADIYLFMALSYTGHDDQLFPEEGQFVPGRELG